MKERFEFTDGSYYEFERLSDAFITEKRDWVVKSMYLNLLVGEPDKHRIPPRTDLVHFIPVDEVNFRNNYCDGWKAGRKYTPRGYRKGAYNQEVIGVGLTYSSMSQCGEFDNGIYLPVKFDIRANGNLFVDVATIVSEVLYEPALAPLSVRKLIKSRTT